MAYIRNSLKHKYKLIVSFVKAASEVSMDKPAAKLLEKVREVLRLKHYSPKTEESYVHWIRQFVRSSSTGVGWPCAARSIEDFGSLKA